MTTARFSLTGFASRVFETEAWLGIVLERFGARSANKPNRVEGLETKWEISLKQQQKEAHTLCHHAIHKLIPMAGTYQLSMLDAVFQASSVYDPEQAEVICREGSKKIEEISGHISGILYNARKMREANRETNRLDDMHAKAIMYHNLVTPYINTLQFHVESLREIMRFHS